MVKLENKNRAVMLTDPPFSYLTHMLFMSLRYRHNFLLEINASDLFTGFHRHPPPFSIQGSYVRRALCTVRQAVANPDPVAV